MKPRQTAAPRHGKTDLRRQPVREQRRRMVRAAGLGFAVNLLYTLYHGVLGILNHSLWLIVMCAYYTVLGTTRLSAVLCGRKSKAAPCDETEYFVMKLSGMLLVLLSFVLAVVNYISLSQNIAARYHEIVMITIAAYTFYKITVAVIRAVKQRGDPSPLLAAIRGIGCAEAAASVLTLQRSMLVSFDGMDPAKARIMNQATGAAVWLFVLLLGISMTMRGSRKG